MNAKGQNHAMTNSYLYWQSYKKSAIAYRLYHRLFEWLDRVVLESTFSPE